MQFLFLLIPASTPEPTPRSLMKLPLPAGNTTDAAAGAGPGCPIKTTLPGGGPCRKVNLPDLYPTPPAMATKEPS